MKGKSGLLEEGLGTSRSANKHVRQSWFHQAHRSLAQGCVVWWLFQVPEMPCRTYVMLGVGWACRVPPVLSPILCGCYMYSRGWRR